MQKIMKHNGDKADILTHMDTLITVLVGYGLPTGLGVDIESYLTDYVDGRAERTEVGERLARLRDAVFSEDHDQIESVLRYFLGRGWGATPTGDDHVVGLLAIDTLTDTFSPVFRDKVRELIDHEAITTKESEFFLDQALQGRFMPMVAAIMHDLVTTETAELKPHMLELLPIGHSTGIDTTFGMLLGMLAVKQLEED